GAGLSSRLCEPAAVRRWAVACCGLTTAIGLAAWQDFASLDVARAADFGNLPRWLTGHDLLVLDWVSAPLLPLTALLYLLTIMATSGSKVARFPFRRTLICQAVVLTALSANEPWLIIALLSVETLFPLMELRSRARPTRVFALHMLVFIACMVCGQVCLVLSYGNLRVLWCGQILLLLAVSIRSGLALAHCWLTDLFEQASFGTALLFVTPLMGAYALTRLLLPVAGEGILRSLGCCSSERCGHGESLLPVVDRNAPFLNRVLARRQTGARGGADPGRFDPGGRDFSTAGRRRTLPRRCPDRRNGQMTGPHRLPAGRVPVRADA
ncbi:MAG TPA: proton-conducting transporter membrane subunit, partial [Gemmataceae bacterium]|nr:proton-conducting transporter membrane subunit [Gemmataceae bacterium]